MSRMARREGADEVLRKLEEWVAASHQHHHGCESMDWCCPDSEFPYVNSLNLVAKIRELRSGE